MSPRRPPRLTEEAGQPGGLVVVDDGHTQRVEGHQAQHRPVEGLRLHHAADGDAQETLLTPEIRRRASLGAPDARPGRGDALGGLVRTGESKRGLLNPSVCQTVRAPPRKLFGFPRRDLWACPDGCSPTEEMSPYCSSPGCPRCTTSIPLLLMVVALFNTAGPRR